MSKTDFSTWDPKNLVKFCFEASQMLADQDKEIKGLREDLKAAIKAYREINKKIQKD